VNIVPKGLILEKENNNQSFDNVSISESWSEKSVSRCANYFGRDYFLRSHCSSCPDHEADSQSERIFDRIHFKGWPKW
jgi:hypothetical protein